MLARGARSTPAQTLRPRRNHRTIFISDTHLGTRGCKAEALADFLAHNECSTLFLVGDIVDGWQLKRRWYWNEAQSRVVAEILHKVDNGTRVIFVPGNHDEFARDYAGRQFLGGIGCRHRSEQSRPSTKPPTDDAFWCCMATASTASSPAPNGWPMSATGPMAWRCAGTIFCSKSRKAAGAALLVALGLAEAQSQERGRIHLPLRRSGGGGSAQSEAWTGWFAAISTMPKSARSAACFISTTETGLKAAAPLSKMPAEIWRFFAGPLPLRDNAITAAAAEAAAPALIPA